MIPVVKQQPINEPDANVPTEFRVGDEVRKMFGNDDKDLNDLLDRIEKIENERRIEENRPLSAWESFLSGLAF